LEAQQVLDSDRWFENSPPRPSDTLRLFCLPYAGGSVYTYTNWRRSLAGVAETYPLQLPGRGTRMLEPAFTSLPALLKSLESALLPHLDRPFAIFGHSMGAMIAFELARVLEKSYSLRSQHLFFSGRLPPQLAQNSGPAYDLPTPQFISELRLLEGTPDEILNNQELMALVLPVLRADLQLVQTYQHVPGEPLNSPITVLGGRQDSTTPASKLGTWAAMTRSSCSVRIFPGNHFFLNQFRSAVINVVSSTLSRASVAHADPTLPEEKT
jgi:medium-chain acyl-[acyl-carrier-protein] hydrolase